MNSDEPSWMDLFRGRGESPVHGKIRSNLATELSEQAEIVFDFINAVASKAHALAVAIRNRNPVETLVVAHWMKESGRASGFPCFTTAADEICFAVCANDWPRIERQATDIVDFAGRLEQPPEVPVR